MKPSTCLRSYLCSALFVISVSEVRPQMAAAGAITISGQVFGGSGRHSIHVAIWDEKGFLQHPVAQMELAPQHPPEFHFNVAPGRWALSAFEDENGNHVLDMGMFGPKEPSGFLRAFHGWHKPRFSDVSVFLDRDAAHADIHLGK